MKGILGIVAVLVMAFYPVYALAAPALPVAKPPLQPVPSWTGPPRDPHAVMGQWFCDVAGGNEQVRPYEFYDNVESYGGSMFRSFLAIEGYVQNIQVDATGAIISFDIQASITNDTPDIRGQWQEGGNAHGELTPTRTPYECDMYDVKMTVEFADDGIQGNLPTGGPYSAESNIYALNYEELAWYCWTPNNPAGLTPNGAYLVPTYDFGDIVHWQTVTRILPFGLYTPAPPGTPLYNFLTSAQSQDVLLNRTTSLKISDYPDGLAVDIGIPYPVPPNLSSDVSVFFKPIPEPSTLLLLSIAAVCLLAYARRKCC